MKETAWWMGSAALSYDVACYGGGQKLTSSEGPLLAPTTEVANIRSKTDQSFTAMIYLAAAVINSR